MAIELEEAIDLRVAVELEVSGSLEEVVDPMEVMPLELTRVHKTWP